MKYDVIVIGGGIAGLTASIYIKRGLKNVLVLESSTIGGQIITSSSVENYPGYDHIDGATLANNIYNQAKNLDIDIKLEDVLSIEGVDNNFIVNTNSNKYEAKKVIIATGATPRKLNIPNEDKYIGRGISFCATCDGAFFKNKDVLVVGGGSVAIEDAIYLSNIANKVYLIHRRDTFKAEEVNLNILKNKSNVEIITNANLINIIGNDTIDKAVIDIEGVQRELNVDGIFIAIGRIPNSNKFDVAKTSDGYIITNDELETNIKGIYAIGDVRDKEVRQLTTAAADGTIASINILKKI